MSSINWLLNEELYIVHYNIRDKEMVKGDSNLILLSFAHVLHAALQCVTTQKYSTELCSTASKSYSTV